MKTISLISILFCCWACQKTVNPPPEEIPASAVSLVFHLPEEIDESSGLVVYHERLLTHNDSGDLPYLYQVNLTDGSLENIFFIENTIHRDWEGMTQNESHIFVGDFGNNSGLRTDLVIYQLDKSDLTLVDSIPFSLAHQLDVDADFEMHNFNMEAMITTEENLFLFSKNHANQQTDLYAIDLQHPASMDSLHIIQSFDTQGLVTDAAYWAANKTLVLLGYTNTFVFEPFVWIISDFEAPNFFSGTIQKIDLGVNEQVEGITFLDETTLLISSEKEQDEGGKVFRLDL